MCNGLLHSGGDASLVHLLLDVFDVDFPAVEDAGGERCGGFGVVEDVLEVGGRAGAGGGDDGDAHRCGHELDEFEVEAVPLPILVDAVEEDFAGAERFDGFGELERANVAPFAPAGDGALVPAVPLAVGPWGGRLHRLVLALLGGVDVDAARVDGHHHRLRAVALGDLFDGGGAVALAAGGDEALRGKDGVGPDGDFVRAGAEVLRRHLEARVRPPFRVGKVADAAAHGERDEHRLARALHHLEHRRVLERKIAVPRNVEEGDLVGALVKVALRELDGLAKVAHVAAAATVAAVAGIRRLPHVVRVALGHH
mmetsp:Transcript_7877/g.26155  ORF Transcript_7877/g.26155 Transcript_7877/m.26155 type:complete len:311 (+) Transcript_7877:66-998(+)